MKYLLFVVLFVVFAAAHSFPLNGSPTDCLVKLGITEEQIGSFNPDDETVPQPIKDLFLCSLKQFDVFSDESGFDLDKIMEIFSSMGFSTVGARKVAEECADKNEQKSTPADWAYRGLMCLKNKNFTDLLEDGQGIQTWEELLEFSKTQ